jgi:hypothetical protein
MAYRSSLMAVLFIPLHRSTERTSAQCAPALLRHGGQEAGQHAI